MKLDSAIKEFMEKYDREAFGMIDDLANDFGLNAANHKIELFDIKDSFDKFNMYIERYADYKIKNKNNPKATDQAGITEAVHRFLESDDIGVSREFVYRDIPSAITAYHEGVSELIKTVDHVKDRLIDADIEMEAVGCMNDYTDMFMERINSCMDQNMDKLLGASGWKTKQQLFNSKRKPKENPVFL